MTAKIKLTCLVVGVLFVVSSACKDDDPQPAFEYQSQGFVRGKLEGKTSDNSFTFNESFNFTQYSLVFGGGISTYEINDDGTYSIKISRASFINYGTATIAFDLDGPSDTTPANLHINFNYTKELSDKYISFSMLSFADNTSSVTDLKFNVTSGRCTGKFSLSGAENSTGKPASIAGEFDVVAKQPVE